MAGHSQFKNIMHRKGAQDAKRAKVFTKIIRELTVSSKMGPDPQINPRLRAAMDAAREANMPKDTMERAIKRGAGGEAQENYEEVRYEGYGPGGAALIVEALTDNRNRTASEVRSTFSKYGGALGENNSVSFMFDRIGSIAYPLSIGDEDKVLEAIIEVGADSYEIIDDAYEMICASENLNEVRISLEKHFGKPQRSELSWKPKNLTALNEHQAESLFKMLNILEDNDDVQNVFGNYDIPDDIMTKLSK
jgi:YebC/PmpR family DNA-binding regulatory protein